MWLFRCIFCWLLFHLLLLGATYETFAQKYKGDVWCWGDSAGIDWTNPVSPINFRSNYRGRCGTATISDSLNNLLLYAGFLRDGASSYKKVSIRNNYHKSVQFGDTIIGEEGFHSMLFIPKPGNDSIIYFFSNIVVAGLDPYGLYYSEINYKANNDSGVVIQKNVQLNNLPAFDGLAAVHHGNGRDWWLIFKDWDPTPPYTMANTFYIYLIDENGPALHHAQSVGSLHNSGGGHLLFNKLGNKLFHCTWQGLLQYFDFDRCTGQLSNNNIIENFHLSQPYPYYGAISLSPNENILYATSYTQYSAVGSTDSLYQFDLAASNVLASKTPIHGMSSTNVGIGSLRLAPDNKIYVASTFYNFYPYQDTSYNIFNSNLSVINSPDSLGLGCDFQPFSFSLGGARTYSGLPNNPDYELGAWVGSPCDTLSVGLNPNPAPEASWMQAWYNHEWDMIHVNASKLQGKNGVLRLFDLEGRLVFEKQAEIISGGYFTTEINMSGLANGVYMVNLVTEHEKISGKVGKY
jgi:hypothetical protein